MLYNSDSYVVVAVDLPSEAGAPARGGFEIVDKHARKDIFIEGAVAESFKLGVEAISEAGPDTDAYDAFIANYVLLAQQPLILH